VGLVLPNVRDKQKSSSDPVFFRRGPYLSKWCNPTASAREIKNHPFHFSGPLFERNVIFFRSKIDPFSLQVRRTARLCLKARKQICEFSSA
jgi:hypothetical protein